MEFGVEPGALDAMGSVIVVQVRLMISYMDCDPGTFAEMRDLIGLARFSPSRREYGTEHRAFMAV
jgi:hypothetical protein